MRFAHYGLNCVRVLVIRCVCLQAIETQISVNRAPHESVIMQSNSHPADINTFRACSSLHRTKCVDIGTCIFRACSSLFRIYMELTRFWVEFDGFYVNPLQRFLTLLHHVQYYRSANRDAQVFRSQCVRPRSFLDCETHLDSDFHEYSGAMHLCP